jgi:hypothetical protein
MADNRYYYFKDAKGNRHTVDKTAYDKDPMGFAKAFPGARMEVIDRKTGRRGDVSVKDASRVGDFGAHLFTGRTITRGKGKPNSSALGRAQQSVAQEKWGGGVVTHENTTASENVSAPKRNAVTLDDWNGGTTGKESELVKGLRAADMIRKRDEEQMPIDYTKPGAVKQMVGGARRAQKSLERRMEQAGQEAGRNAEGEIRRRNAPAFDLGNENVNNNLVKTRGQLEKEMEESAATIADKNFADTFANMIAGERQAAEKRGFDAYLQRTVFSATPMGSTLLGTIAYNAERDPAKLQQNLLNTLGKNMESMLSDPNVAQKVVTESKRLGVDPEDYVKTALMPSIQNKLMSEYDKTELKEWMPRNTFVDIIDGLGDGFQVGSILDAALTKAQRQYRQRAIIATQNGENPYYQRDKYGVTEGVRSALSLASDVIGPGGGVLGGIGKGVGAASAKVFGNEVKTIARMANMSKLQRMFKPSILMRGAAETGANFGIYEGLKGAQSYSSTTDDVKLGEMLENSAVSAAHGAVSGATLGVVGKMLGGLGYNVGIKGPMGVDPNFGKNMLKGLGMKGVQIIGEGTAFYAGGNFNNALSGADTDWSAGNLLSNIMAAGIYKIVSTHTATGAANMLTPEKGQSYGGSVAVKFGTALYKAAMAPSAQGKAFAFTPDEKQQLFASGDKAGLPGKEGSFGRQDILTWAERVMKATPVGKEDKSGNVKVAREYYESVMQDPNVSWDAKMKLNALLGIAPATRPEMDMRTYTIEDGKRYVNEYAKDGTLLSKRSYKNMEQREAIEYDLMMQKENQRMLNGLGYILNRDCSRMDLQMEFLRQHDYDFDNPDSPRNQAIMDDMLGNNKTLTLKRGRTLHDEWLDFVSENGITTKLIKDIADAHGLSVEEMFKIVNKEPIKRTEEEQRACVELRKALNNIVYEDGMPHADQADSDGKDVVEENNLGTENPNNEAVAEVLNNMNNAEKAFNAALESNDVLKQEYERLTKEGLSEPQIYMELINSGLTQEQLAPFADYINAKAKAVGMYRGTEQKIAETVQKHVEQWSYKGELNGEKQEGGQMLFVKDNNGRLLIVGAGDVAFDSEGRARENVGDMLSVLDPNTKEMDFVSKKDVQYDHVEKTEDYAKNYQEMLEVKNSEVYAQNEQQKQMENAAGGVSPEGGKPNGEEGVKHSYTLGEKKAGNGEPFYQDESGNIDLATIPDEVFEGIGYTKAPFRLTPSMIKHMLDRHNKELGFKDEGEAINFVVDVMNNFDHVRLGYDGALVFSIENGRKRTGKRAVTVLINSDNGEFYGLKTSGYEGIKGLEKRPLLWERGANETSSTDAASASVTTSKGPISGGQSGSASHQGNGLHDKDSNNSPNGNGNKETLTFADGSPVPMMKDTKGRETADYSQMTPEHGAEWMSSQFGENAEAAVDGQIKRAEKMLKEAEMIKVDYTGDLNDAKEAEAQKAKAVDAAKAELELYTNIKKVMTANKVKAGMEKVGSVGEEGSVSEAGNLGAVREKFESGKRIVGNKRTRTLADGSKLRGHYEIVEADSLTPSHNANDGYKKSEGFPVNEEGRTINDRDYENDKQAQMVTDMIAMKYDGQAVDQVPVVTSDGIVVDGNGRTMAGQKAAKNGTDSAYLEALKENAENYGFTAEQIEQSGIKHPRLVLVSDEPMKYDTATFAKFNKNEKKSQGNTQQAVANSKKLSADEIGTIISEIEGSGSLDAFFNNPTAINSLLKRLIDKGVIGLNEIAGLREGEDKLSAAGKDFVKNLLLGSVFSENTIRMMGADAMLKTKALNGIRAVTDNMKLGDYALMKEIDQAVQLLYEARQGGSGVDAYLRTPAMFGENAADRYDPISQAIALALESKVEDFRELMMAYNRNAAHYADASQAEMFGERPTKEDFVNEFLKLRNWKDYETRHSSKEGNGDAGSSEGGEPETSGGSGRRRKEGLAKSGNKTLERKNIGDVSTEENGGALEGDKEGKPENDNGGSPDRDVQARKGQREVDKAVKRESEKGKVKSEESESKVEGVVTPKGDIKDATAPKGEEPLAILPKKEEKAFDPIGKAAENYKKDHPLTEGEIRSSDVDDIAKDMAVDYLNGEVTDDLHRAVYESIYEKVKDAKMKNATKQADNKTETTETPKVEASASPIEGIKNAAEKFAKEKEAAAEAMGEVKKPQQKADDAAVEASNKKVNDLWNDLLKAGREDLSASFIGLNARQLEVLPKLVSAMAENAYLRIKRGMHNLEDVVKEMRKEFAPAAQVFKKEDVDAIYEQMMNIRYRDGEQRMSLKEWADYYEKSSPKHKEELVGDSKEAEDRKLREKRFVDKVNIQLGFGHKFNGIVELRKMAEKCGLKDVKDTDLQELAETAIVQRARGIASSESTNNTEKFKRIKKLYENQPSLNQRDSERVMKQQYSTPAPYAFLADMYVKAGIEVKSALEPSAGNGMLTIGLPKDAVHVNDIDAQRLANLQRQGFKNITSQDGTQPFADKDVDVVVTNPPFGSATPRDYDGYTISSLEGQMAINALESMKDNGRAAIIIGGKTEYAKNGSLNPKDKALLGYLYSHYNVEDVINVDGSLYAKQGTTYPTRIILINGRRFDENAYPPVKDKARAEAVKSYDELYKRINDDILRSGRMGSPVGEGGEDANAKPNRPGVANTNEEGVRAGGNGGGEQKPSVRTGGVHDKTAEPVSDNVLGTEGGTKPGENGGLPDGTTGANGAGADVTQSEGAGNNPNPEGRVLGSGGNGRPNTQPNADGATNTGSGGRPRGQLERVDRPVRGLSAEKVAYTPRSENPFTFKAVMPADQQEAVNKNLEKLGDADQFLVDELGYNDKADLYAHLAAEQVDSVALALQQAKKGNAFIIGDMTGVGKGRQAASFVRYAVKNGQIPIYFTQKANLLSDVYRDLVDIGSPDLRPFILGSQNEAAVTDSEGKVIFPLPSKKEKQRVLDYIEEHGELPKEYDYILTTYSQVGNGVYEFDENGNRKERKLAKGKKFGAAAISGQARRDAIEKLMKNGYLILDESHTAGGNSGQGNYFQHIIQKAKNVTFFSATFAKCPDNMPIYALRTAMNQGGLKASDLIGAVKRGGATLQEVMSQALTQCGQMIRRERDMTGVTIDWKTIDDPEVVAEQREQYDSIIGLFNDIINFQRTYVSAYVDRRNEELAEVQSSMGIKRGTEALGIKNQPFASKAFNTVQQVLLSLKAKSAAERAIDYLKQGMKPVIALNNTNESQTGNLALGEEMDAPDLGTSLKKGLEGTLRYTSKNAKDESESGYINLKALGADAVEAYHALEEKIRKTSTGLSLSPIDVIKNELTKAGYKVGELTGRQTEFVYNENGTVTKVKRADTDKKKLAREFNDGQIDALILNKSAATGISLHASSKYADQRKRVMIVAQQQLDVNDEVQMRGRIDRTGQVARGAYEYVVSLIPAEQRLLMMFKAKLKSLDANTTSSQKSKFNEMEVADITNKYGDKVVKEYMSEHLDLYARMADPFGWEKSYGADLSAVDPQKLVASSDGKNSEAGGDANKLLGRMALLKVKEQEKMLQEIGDLYAAEIQRLNEMGENDLEITELPLKAKTLDKIIWKEGTEPGGDNAFADNTYVEKVNMAVLKKPMKAEEVKKAQDGLTGGKSWDEYRKEKLTAAKEYFDKKIAEATQKYEERAVKAATKAKEKYIKEAKKGQKETGMSDEQIEKMAGYQYESIYSDEKTKLDEVVKNLKAKYGVFERALETFNTEDAFVLPTDMNNPAELSGFGNSYGRLIDIKITDNFSPNASTISFATLDGRRKITFPINGKAGLGIDKVDVIGIIDRQTRQASSQGDKKLRVLSMDASNWDKLTSNESRKDGYIITGNLLQGLIDTKAEFLGAQLVKYTTDTGEVKTGILLSDKVKLNNLANEKPINSVAEKFELPSNKGGITEITSSDGDVKIEQGFDYIKMTRNYTIRVPKSNKKGGKYFLDKELLKMVDGGNFETRGNTMLAEVKEEKLKDVLDRLSELGVKVKEESKVHYRIELGDTFSDSKEHFDAVRDRAVEEKGIVMPNLNKEKVKVVEVEKHNFGSKERETINNAKAWAISNLVTTGNQDLPTMRDGTSYTISKKAIEKYLSESAVKKSENLDTHLSVLTKLTDVIHESIEAEIHADYNVKDETGKRKAELGYGNNILVHRLYGAVEMDGKIYRVKTTMQEFRGGEENKPHSYEVTKIELLDSPGKRENPDRPPSDASNNSIDTAKLLQGVEKSYDSGKKLLDESKNLTDGETFFRKEGDGVVTPEKTSGTSNAVSERIIKTVEKVAKRTGGKVKMVNSVEEIENPKVRKDIENGKQVTGWYDEKTGEVHLYMPNIHDSYTAEKTVWHETVGHKGMRGLLGDKFNDYMRSLWMDLDNPINAELRAYVKEKMNMNHLGFYDAIEEFIAKSAEDGKGEPGFWNYIKNKVTDALHEIGYRVSPNVKDVKYMLWLAKNVQKHGDSPLWKMRAEAVRWKIEHEKTLSVVEENGMMYDNNGKKHGLLDLNKKDFDEATDGHVHYRTSPMTASKIEEYNRRLSTKWYAFKESTVDDMQSLQEAMQIISGVKDAYADIPSAFNPLQCHNRMGSMVMQMCERYDREYTEPLGDAFKKVVSAMPGKDGAEQTRNANLYFIKKHGLERNRVLFVRDKIREERKVKSEESDSIDALETAWKGERSDLRQKLDSGQIDLREYYRQMDEWIVQNLDKDFKAEEHDYSGMHGIYDVKKGEEYDDANVIDEVMSTESQLGADLVKSFWDAKKKATDFTIDQVYANGFMDKNGRDHLKEMFDWYVPLRKFDDTVAEDVYGYISGSDTKNYIGSVIEKARGRESLSDVNVLAQISALAKSSILNGGKNVEKQHFMRFVEAYEKGDAKDRIFVEIQPWVEKHTVDGNEVWEEVMPNIPENSTQEQINDILNTFEDTMKAKQAHGEAKIARRKSDIGYKFERSSDMNQHIVNVYVNGRVRRFVCQGNPRAAQAINGLLRDSGTQHWATEQSAKLNRYCAQLNTSLNPDFVSSNLVRDLTAGSANLVVKEGMGYTWDFCMEYAKNWGSMVRRKDGGFDGGYLGMFRRYKDGRLDANNQKERWFKEFMDNGGETGFVSLKKYEDIIKEYENLVKTGNKEGDRWLMKKLKEGGAFIELANEVVENVARYSTYCVSRKRGRSIGKSIYDAKEVSSNFNRHGSGDAIKSLKTGYDGKTDTAFRKPVGWFNSWMKNHTMFYNAGVQGANLFAKNLYNNTKTTAIAFGAMPFGLSLAVALFNLWRIGREDEKKRNGVKNPYAELPEWKRRNNICIYWGGGKFKTIPMGIELRAFYGLGDIAAGYVVDESLKSDVQIGWDIIGQMAQLVPASDFLGHHSPSSGIKELGEDVALSVIPTIAKPEFELAFNRDWTGRPIYRDKDYLDKAPRWKRAYDSTNDVYMTINKWANKTFNGIDSTNEDLKGSGMMADAVDFFTAPYGLQHIVEGYTGGTGATIGRMYQTGKSFAKGVVSGIKDDKGFAEGFNKEWDKVDPNTIPFYRVFNYTPKEGNDMQRTKSKWYNYADELERLKYNMQQMKTNTPDTAKNIHNAATKFKLSQSKDGRKLKIYEAADRYIAAKRRILKRAKDKAVVEAVNEAINRKMQEAVEDLDRIE